MKAYTIIKNAVLILSVAILGLAGILAATSTGTASASALVVIIAVIPTAVLGIFLVFTKNDISKKVGYALMTSAFLLDLIQALTLSTGSVAVILMIVAFALYAIYYIIWGVGLLATRGRASVDPDTDPKITLLKKWKDLLDEGMITKEEFEEKRTAILGLKKK